METKYTIERNSAIELYRILLMFGICWLHCVCQGRWSGLWPRYALGFCVPGFVLITGYFGVDFKLSKVVRLYSVPVYASLLAPLMGGSFAHGCYWREVLRVWDADGGFWFIHAYVVLMIFAPFLNACFETATTSEGKCRLFRALLPMWFLVFCWMAGLNYNHMRLFVPSTSGLTANSFLTFIGVYSIGRIIRIFKLDYKIPYHICVMCAIILFAMAFLIGGPVSHSNNIVAVLQSVLLFMVIKRIKLRRSYEKFVLQTSPFMLAVYCISGTVYFPFTKPIFFSVIEYLKDELFGCGFSPLLATFTTALIVFVLGMILALPQFAVALLHKDKLKRFYSFIDNGFEYTVLKISRVIG